MEHPLDGWATGGELSRADRAGIVLGAARTHLHGGWQQNAWHVVDRGDGRRRLRASRLGVDRTTVRASCLLGAVFVAAGDFSDRAEDAAPAVDALWHELHRGGLGLHESIDRVCAPALRVLRMRDLIRWNDRPGRTHADVLDLVDRTLLLLSASRV